MANKRKQQKSTTKYRKFKVSPLISIIAILEVIILIGVCTYTWFIFSANKTVDSGTITVDPDSGLDIDFKNATTADKINIWEYVDRKTFKFEPCTSLDGRNLYFPTSGTFDNDQTSNITFRDATVNDINSKYLNIDFQLSNSSDRDMEVYLDDSSYFQMKDANEQKIDSKALRLAFYSNDGNQGNVAPSLLYNSDADADDTQEIKDACTLYFDAKYHESANWNSSSIYAYLWSSSGTQSQEYLKSWPGSTMSKSCGRNMSITFSNPIITVNGHQRYLYDKVKFTNGYSGPGNETNAFNVTNGKVYDLTMTEGASGNDYGTYTVYFRKPSSWGTVKCYAWHGSTYETSAFPGDSMHYVSGDIWSIDIKDTCTGFNFNDGSSSNKTADISAGTGGVNANGRVYYFPQGSTTGDTSSQVYGTTNIYFYNTLGWSTPKATCYDISEHPHIFTMSNLSGNVFYCTIPTLYTGSTGSHWTSVYFSDNESNTTRTVISGDSNTGVVAGNIYYCSTEKNSSGYYLLTNDNYDTYVGKGTYAVISPGVSAGFQRAYTPVVKTDALSGDAQSIVPAFASSLDNYIYGSDNPMFTLPHGKTMTLSMVVWLEGTDADCTAENYAGENIDLYLKFSTTLVNAGEKSVYKYRFIDSTKEVWTSDKITDAAGRSVSPVMQLYDVIKGRGYLMSPASYASVDGKNKVSVWECTAPQELTSDNTKHKFEFRRVNPYDEREVWNVWQAGFIRNNANSDIIPEAMTNRAGATYISFTAFSDGAPANMTVSGHSEMNTPELSCGGIWGEYETKLVTLLDASNGRRIHNTNDSTDEYLGVATLNYQYKYTDGTVRTIEYKASGSYRSSSMYVFVIPSSIYNSTTYLNSTTMYVKHYTHFLKRYALNSDRQPDNLRIQDAWTLESPNGAQNYIQVNENWNAQNVNASNVNIDLGSNSQTTYWGKDLQYLQISYTTINGASNFYLQSAHFVMNYFDGDSHSNYTYLRNTDTIGEFGIEGTYRGNVSVVPITSSNTRIALHRVGVNGTTESDWGWSNDNSNWYYHDAYTVSKFDKWQSVSGQSDHMHYENFENTGWPGVKSKVQP